jgi:hypothetical protein
MRHLSLKPLRAFGCALICLLSCWSSARANFLVNGDFSNGLGGWTASSPSLVTLNAAHQVVLHESATATVTLFQDFTLPTGARLLTFTLVGTTVETGGSGIIPDAFNVSLLNPTTQVSLVPTVNATTDAYYIRDLVQGAPTANGAPGVTVSDLGGGAMRIDLDISAMGGHDGRLLFRLIGGGVNTTDTVTLADVQVDGNSGVGAVPAPGGLLLTCSGLFTFAAYGWKHRRSSLAHGP